MEKRNINLIMHVLVPFFIMVLTNQLLLILFNFLHMDVFFAELLSFIPASIGGMISFKLIRFDMEVSDDENDGGHIHVRPLSKCRPVVSVLHVMFGIGALTGIMFLVTAFASDTDAAYRSFTALSFISLCFIHPILEEYVFRWLFYGDLRKMHPSFGCLVQAVMFAIIHNSVHGMIFALGSGVFLGIIAEKTGRLLPVIVVHSLINLRSLLYMTVMLGMDQIQYRIDVVLVSAGLAAFVVLTVMKRIEVIRSSAESSDDPSDQEEKLP